MGDSALEVPPEAMLLRQARETRGLTVKDAVVQAAIRITATRWAEIEAGVDGHGERTRAYTVALAGMAEAIGLGPDELAEAGRRDAARLMRVPRHPRSSTNLTDVSRLIRDRRAELGMTRQDVAEQSFPVDGPPVPAWTAERLGELEEVHGEDVHPPTLADLEALGAALALPGWQLALATWSQFYDEVFDPLDTGEEMLSDPVDLPEMVRERRKQLRLTHAELAKRSLDPEAMDTDCWWSPRSLKALEDGESTRPLGQPEVRALATALALPVQRVARSAGVDIPADVSTVRVLNLSVLARRRRADLVLTLQAVADRCSDPEFYGTAAAWTVEQLEELEAVATTRAPPPSALRALAVGLALPVDVVRTAAQAKLSTRVRARRLELGLSLEALVKRCRDPEMRGLAPVWSIQRLEELEEVGCVPPAMHALRALAAGLALSHAEVQLRASGQYYGQWAIWDSRDLHSLRASPSTPTQPKPRGRTLIVKGL